MRSGWTMPTRRCAPDPLDHGVPRMLGCGTWRFPSRSDAGVAADAGRRELRAMVGRVATAGTSSRTSPVPSGRGRWDRPGMPTDAAVAAAACDGSFLPDAAVGTGSCTDADSRSGGSDGPDPGLLLLTGRPSGQLRRLSRRIAAQRRHDVATRVRSTESWSSTSTCSPGTVARLIMIRAIHSAASATVGVRMDLTAHRRPPARTAPRTPRSRGSARERRGPRTR